MDMSRPEKYNVIMSKLCQMVGQIDAITDIECRRCHKTEIQLEKIVSETADWILGFIIPIRVEDGRSAIITWVENNEYSSEVDFEELCRIVNDIF